MTPTGAAAVAAREAPLAAAARMLAGAAQVGLVCHITPDGDALGSMLALGLGLRSLGKQVSCSWGTVPLDLPATYTFLPGQELLVDVADFPDRPELLVVLDTGSRERIGLLADRADAAAAVLVVDHHAHNSGLDGRRLVDETAPATAVLVAELLERLGVALTPEIATCLYTALSTDTGSFRHAATNAESHLLAARLLDARAPHADISRRVFDTNGLGYLRLLGAALGRLRYEPAAAHGHGLVWTQTLVADLDAYRVAFDELERVIDVLRTAAEADVAVVCKQDRDGSLKVSMRSKGAFDVGSVCASLGGGGHRLAAGFTAHASAEQVVAELCRRLDEAPVRGR